MSGYDPAMFSACPAQLTVIHGPSAPLAHRDGPRARRRASMAGRDRKSQVRVRTAKAGPGPSDEATRPGPMALSIRRLKR